MGFLNYFEHLLILVSSVTGSISIFSFASLVGISKLDVFLGLVKIAAIAKLNCGGLEECNKKSLKPFQPQILLLHWWLSILKSENERNLFKTR